MAWNRDKISEVAVAGAQVDYAAFEAIGLAEIEDAAVLDVGCFDGFNTVLKFKPYGNVARVVGIDPGREYIDAARSATDDERFSWECACAEAYDGAEGSFDLVYYSHSFQHLADRCASLANAYRLLKPGGFIVIKTVDDALYVSQPDPEHVMERARALYDEAVRPHRAHTANTDRYVGSKCYALLQKAGFANARLKVQLTDTAGKSLDERLALFDRITYYRKSVPEVAGAEAQARMDELLACWRELFKREDYYFASPTVVAFAQKPGPGTERFAYMGPWFDTACALPVSNAQDDGLSKSDCGRWTLAPMKECHLGEVMAIEIVAFPDPWAPIAYLAELRHNPMARYAVAIDAAGKVGGYIGWWIMPDEAFIAHVAVDPNLRRSGAGRALVEHACKDAVLAGKERMGLNVRAANEGARAFYQALGFVETGLASNYYTAPDDDGIVMYRSLHHEDPDE